MRAGFVNVEVEKRLRSINGGQRRNCFLGVLYVAVDVGEDIGGSLGALAKMAREFILFLGVILGGERWGLISLSGRRHLSERSVVH